MKIKKNLTTISVLFILSLSVYAEDKNKEMSKESREQIAQMHNKMAECLRSDKSFDDCHDEIRNSCQKMDMKYCPMMGEMGMGMGKSKWKKNR